MIEPLSILTVIAFYLAVKLLGFMLAAAVVIGIAYHAYRLAA